MNRLWRTWRLLKLFLCWLRRWSTGLRQWSKAGRNAPSHTGEVVQTAEWVPGRDSAFIWLSLGHATSPAFDVMELYACFCVFSVSLSWCCVPNISHVVTTLWSQTAVCPVCILHFPVASIPIPGMPCSAWTIPTGIVVACEIYRGLCMILNCWLCCKISGVWSSVVSAHSVACSCRNFLSNLLEGKRAVPAQRRFFSFPSACCCCACRGNVRSSFQAAVQMCDRICPFAR